MHDLLSALALILFASSATVAVTSPFHTYPLCWNESRIYHPGGDIAANLMQLANDRIGITRVPKNMPTGAAASPNGAYSYAIEESAIASDLSILVFNERPYLLEISARQIHNLNEVEWISERLLFLRLWFGRIAGVDAIIDVEQEEIVLIQPFQDGQISYQQWHESCSTGEWLNTDICNVPCHVGTD